MASSVQKAARLTSPQQGARGHLVRFARTIARHGDDEA
jgi:hypothetical protein